MNSHELAIQVTPEDIDVNGHVNNVVYLRWVQEAAVAHWMSAAPEADRHRFVWIVLRHEIDYRKPAFAGDEIIARTWVGSASRVRFERFTDILRASDLTVLASARTVWCPVDPESGRPVSVTPEVRAVFSVPGTSPDVAQSSLRP